MSPTSPTEQGRRPSGWALVAAVVVGLIAFAGVAVVFSDQMAGEGDAADEPRDDAGVSTPSTVDPTAGTGPLVSVIIDGSDPNVLLRSEPAGIDCGPEPRSGEWRHKHCEARFEPGAEVTLNATIPPVVMELLGQAGWVGCDEPPFGSFSPPPPCTMTLDVDRTVCLFTGFDDCPADIPRS
jgi:hypothetical protein